jgi:hypothetical protein
MEERVLQQKTACDKLEIHATLRAPLLCRFCSSPSPIPRASRASRASSVDSSRFIVLICHLRGAAGFWRCERGL